MGFSIQSNSQYFLNHSLSTDNASVKKLEETLKNKPSTDEELMEVCKSFEAYFLEQVMKGMEKTIPYEGKKTPIWNNSGTYSIRNMQKCHRKPRAWIGANLI